MKNYAIFLILASRVLVTCPHSHAQMPDWCKQLPRPEYKVLERVPVSDAWFEVYKVAANTYAIYEPHQSEEVISYLTSASKRRFSSIPAWASATSSKSSAN